MQLEATGKSVEIAIQNGLLECGMKREEVNVQVIEEGGLFKKAKVVLTWGEEVQENKEETVEEVVEANVEEENHEVEESKEEVVEVKQKRIVDSTRIQEKGKEFLLGLAKILDENATCEVSVNENEVSFSLHGEKLGKLIGFHGDNLQALQMLLSALSVLLDF